MIMDSDQLMQIQHKPDAGRLVRENGESRTNAEDALARAESALREQDARLELALRAGLGLWEWNVSGGEFVVHHDRIGRPAGFPEESGACPSPPCDEIHPDDRLDLARRLSSQLDSSSPFCESEYRLRTLGGDWKRVLAWGAVVERDAAGNPLRVVGVHQDAARCKTAEEELGDYRRLLETLLRQTPDGIVICDASGRIHFANEAARALSLIDPLGTSASESEAVWGQAYGEDGQPLSASEWPLARALAGEVAVSCQVRMAAAAGGRHDILLSATPLLDEQQRIAGAVAIFTDLTDRNLVQAALADSEERFINIYDQSLIGIEYCDADGRLINANKAFLDIFGLENGARLKTYRFFDDPNLPESLKNRLLLGETVRYELVYNFELTRQLDLFRSDKTGTAYLDMQITPLGHGGKASVGGFLLQVQDITERSLAQEALRESEKRLEFAIEASNGGQWELLFSVDTPPENFPDSIYLSPRLKEFIGFSDSEIINSRQAWNSHILPEDLPLVEKAELDHLRGKTERHEVEFRMRHKDGGIRWISSRGMIDRDVRGLPVRWSGISMDITKRKLTEEALRDSESKYKSIWDHSPIGIQIYDAGGRLLDSNRSSLEMFGVAARAQLERLRLFEDLKLPKLLRERLQKGESVRHILSLNFDKLRQAGLYQADKTGAMFLDVQVTPLGPECVSAPGGYLFQIQDVTEHKKSEAVQARLEEQLRQAQKMESVGQLAGGIAHDFNNLLLPIIGYAEIALMKVGQLDPLYTDLEQIRMAGERAKELTRQLLAFGSKLVLEMKTLNLNQEIRHFEKMFRRIIREDIVIEIRLHPSPGSVKADPSQLQQVLMNLALNATDAMPNGGRLTLETANVVLDDEYARIHPGAKPGLYLLLAVSDTGCGMSPETLSRIFEPFFTTKKVGKGMGLGLATVYGIVNQHGGSIWVKSRVGAGTTFKIYLPRVEEKPEAPAPSAPDNSPGYGCETILVTEDEAMVRQLTCDVLTRHGYRVLEAQDVHDAIRLAQEHDGPIHLLVSDVVMPHMNGKELYRHIQTARPGIRVLFMSGYIDNVIAQHGALETGIHFLQKPFSVQVLTQKVRAVLDVKE